MGMDCSESPYPWLLCPIGRNWRLQRQGKVSTSDSSARARSILGTNCVWGELVERLQNLWCSSSVHPVIAIQAGVSDRHDCWDPEKDTNQRGKNPSEPN